MKTKILYLGDTSIKEAASYLGGVMSHSKIAFDYASSAEAFKPEWLNCDYKAIVISDYPAANFKTEHFDLLEKKVRAGMGLLMIGGWESFAGAKIEYTSTLLSEILPVTMSGSDDRVNCAQPCLIDKACDHAIVDGLPFDKACPGIGGYNKIKAKADSKIVLRAQRFTTKKDGNAFTFSPITEVDPLLVLGNYGAGRVAAYASDAAPHWVGGFVDWGDSRVFACAPGGGDIEVGNWYAQFFTNLLRWTAQEI